MTFGFSGMFDDKQATLNLNFFTACRLGNLEEAKQLLADGAEIDNEKTDQTPLFAATTSNRREVSLWLLANGADANCHNQQGWSGLHHAVQTGDVELTAAYLAASALVTRQSRKGETPLIVACQQGNEEIARLLLARGANVKAMDKQRNTSLHYAAANGEMALCEALLERGAVITVANDEGKTCVDVATEDVAALLERHAITEVIHEAAPQTKSEDAPAAAPPQRKIMKA